MPKFKIVPVGDKFTIQDDDGYIYGTYNKKKTAEDDAELWREYYNTP
jgi:hypothetical protein